LNADGLSTCDQPSPCGGVGECVDRPGAHHRCRCPSGYYETNTGKGSICEKASDICNEVPNVCSGVGQCTPQSGDFYRCRCQSGFKEVFVNRKADCKPIEGDPCSTLPCGDHGSCQADPTQYYTCSCDEGYEQVERNGQYTCEEQQYTEPEVTEVDEDDYEDYEDSYKGEDEYTDIGEVDKYPTYTVDTDSGDYEETYEGADTPEGLTRCQEDKWLYENHFNQGQESGQDNLINPDCTEFGAYEPLQRRPDGFYVCVDFNGEEFMRSRSRPDCNTKCELEKYYKSSENVLQGTDNDVPNCDKDGEYEILQCNNEGFCHCVDSNGDHMQDTETHTTSRREQQRLQQACMRQRQGEDNRRPQASYPTREGQPPKDIIFAQASGVHKVSFPITADSHASRMYERPGRMFVGVDYDCKDKMVYFSEVRTRSVFRAPIDNFDAKEHIVRRGLKSPEGVAYDHLSGNLYVADSGTKRIEVIRGDGSMRAVVVSKGLNNPRGIAVDPVGGKLYWSDWHRENPRIMRSNMDGTEVERFVTEGLLLPNNLDIDMYQKQLCFIDQGTLKIECMGLDGNNRRVVKDLSEEGSKPRSAFGLEVTQSYLYYTDRKGMRLHQVDIRTGEDISIKGPMGVHGNMLGMSVTYENCPRERNHCSNNNGGCEEGTFCLPVPNGRTCKQPRHHKKR